MSIHRKKKYSAKQCLIAEIILRGFKGGMTVSRGKEFKLIHRTITEMQTEMFCTHEKKASLEAVFSNNRKVWVIQ